MLSWLKARTLESDRGQRSSLLQSVCITRQDGNPWWLTKGVPGAQQVGFAVYPVQYVRCFKPIA